MIARRTPNRRRCSNVYESSGRSTSGSMSFRVRSVSGRRRVPCPPTRITAGRLTRSPVASSHALVLEAVLAHDARIEHVAPVDEQPVSHPLAGLGPVELAQLRPLGHEDGR